MSEPSAVDLRNVAGLVGRRTALRPVVESDYDFLFWLSTDSQTAFRWRHRGLSPSPDSFIQSLWHSALCQFIIVDLRNDEPVGHVLAHDADLRNRHCAMSLIVRPEAAGSGWPLEAAAIFLRFVFQAWDFRKIYAEVIEFNFGQFASGEGWLFDVEGRLRQHEFFADRYWDVLYLAIYRERLQDILKRVAPWLLTLGTE